MRSGASALVKNKPIHSYEDYSSTEAVATGVRGLSKEKSELNTKDLSIDALTLHIHYKGHKFMTNGAAA